MALIESPKQRAFREFMSTKCCVCQRNKPAKNGFCSRCYYSLPKAMQRALWQRFLEGYEEAHEVARNWLKQERRAINAK